jgi:hypothetical protein
VSAGWMWRRGCHTRHQSEGFKSMSYACHCFWLSIGLLAPVFLALPSW